MPNSLAPPAEDEIEISLFGPGRGECVLLHATNNRWIIVDSCLDRKSRQPVALDYLATLGIDPTTAVILFVITHWHDDHIGGAADILARCTASEFVCSQALRSKEFVAFVKTFSKQFRIESSGTDEFDRVFEQLEKRAKGMRRPAVGPNKWASSDCKLLYLSGDEKFSEVEVFALSPSHAAISLALREWGQLLVSPRTAKRKAVAQEPNDVSVALWVRIGDLKILLGSDLENIPNDYAGWKAVVLSKTKPAGQALVVKVPHHGSTNAYCAEMWYEMATSDPIALLTPFAGGRQPLPCDDDINKIRKHTSQIYCTGPSTGWKSPKRNTVVEKVMKEVLRTRRQIYGPMGHVRIRYSPGSQAGKPEIELFNGAQFLGIKA